MTTHTYATTVQWVGSTGLGYRAYPRAHTATAAGTTVTLSASAAFRGDAEHPNPEELLVAAASSCQLLSFLAVAARRRVDVLRYDDRAEGYMDDSERPVRVARIVLRPVITVAAGPARGEVLELARLAHDECFVAHSLSGSVELDVTVVEA
jgi:organic hydroperoxide reductase OsmC/OhrA